MRRDHLLRIRLNEAEYSRLMALQANSNCRFPGEFARRLLTRDGLVLYTRDRSLDDWMEELIGMRMELVRLREGLEQALECLVSCRDIPDFQNWLVLQQGYSRILISHLDSLGLRVDQFARLWLPA